MAEDEKVTGDMSWSYEDVPVTNQHHHNLKSCSSEISCEDGAYHFFDTDGIIHREFP